MLEKLKVASKSRILCLKAALLVTEVCMLFFKFLILLTYSGQRRAYRRKFFIRLHELGLHGSKLIREIAALTRYRVRVKKIANKVKQRTEH